MIAALLLACGDDDDAAQSAPSSFSKDTTCGDCEAEISEHAHVGAAELGWERYRVVGELSCEPAGSDAGSGKGAALEIEAFHFVATISWG